MKKSKREWITCKNDRAFKEIILDEANHTVVKSIIHTILGIDILSIKIETIERNTGNLFIRRKYFDCLISTDNKHIQIEMNATLEDYTRVRNMAYIANTYSGYTLVGEEYTEDVDIIQINLTFGIKEDTKLMRTYFIQDDEHHLFVKNFKIIEINMDKMMELWYCKDKEAIEKYKYLMMLNLKEKDLKKLAKSDGVVKDFMWKMRKLNTHPRYIPYITPEQDQKFIMNTKIHNAEKKGKEEGKLEGAEETNRKAILNLNKNGVSLDLIATSLEISLEEVNKVIHENS